jgi:signal transduction histidine kinase
VEFINFNIANWTDVILLSGVVINALLALLVFLKNYKNISNIAFSLLTVSLCFWSFGNFQIDKVVGYDHILLWTKFTGVAASFFILFLFIFSKVFPRGRIVMLNTFSVLLNIVISLIFSTFSMFTNLVVKDVHIDEIPVSVSYNMFYYPFILWIIIIFGLSLQNLNSKSKFSPTLEKMQIKYVSFGMLGFILSTFATYVILPLAGIFALTRVGAISSIIFTVFTSYTIIKFQFLNIRLVVGKSLYLLLVSIPPYFTYFLLAYIYENIYGTSLNEVAYLLGIPIAIVFSSFIAQFSKYISEYTDTHLINPGYNTFVVLEQHRQRVASTLDVDKLVQESLFIIARTIRPTTSGVILKTNENSNNLISINYKRDPFNNLSELSYLFEVFEIRNIKYLSYDLLQNKDDSSDVDKVMISHIISRMEKYEISLIIPLKEEQKIRGLLLIGYKEAKSPYNNQEIKLLTSIAESMSLAIGRSLLYQEIQKFNLTLQQKVTSATEELQEKNKTLEDTLLKLEEIRRQEKDMLDVMGHELRTPISIARNAIVTLHKHVENQDLDQVKLHKYTKMAVESIRREIALVETFLSTTKLEGQRMQINLESVSLIEIVEDTVLAHKDLALKNKTELIFSKPENDIVVSADKIRIQEVMDNFVNNAIKYTGEGKVEIRIYEDNGLGWVDVQDTGIGISQENIDKLGRKFFRVQKLYNPGQTTVNPSGTGLGLFVSFQLIDMMKGKRKITSKEGEGSTFSFGLPKAQ